MTRVLVVEDDPGVGTALVRTLERNAWHADLAPTAAHARTRLFAGGYDLVLLDVRLPDGDGRAPCREIRATGGPPVIFVTARGDEPSLVEGLGLGAEDYIVKPVRAAELVARARVALRRSGAQHREEPQPRARIDPLELDTARHRVMLDGDELHLTPTEYALLVALATRAGRVVTRDELAQTVWGDGWPPSPKALDVQIRGLRRKLRDDPPRRDCSTPCAGSATCSRRTATAPLPARRGWFRTRTPTGPRVPNHPLMLRAAA